jgi:hypothetical protein
VITYQDEVKNNKNYQGNVVVLIDGIYYSIRQPDSGLVIPSDQARSIISLTVNPTSVDFKKANQTISSYSFRILDKNLVFSKGFENNETLFMGKEVRIWIGRSSVGMDFSNYFELPRVFIQKISHADNSYNFSCKDSTDTMIRDVFNLQTLLQADIFVGTTAFLVSSTEGSGPSGFLKLDDEIVSYSAKTATQFQGIIRGEFGTIPVEHKFGTDIFELFELSGNPIDIALQIWTSTGLGTNGPFDVLPKGLGIDQSLIDVAEMVQLRDDFFSGDVWNLFAYDIDNTLRFMEDEIFQGTGTRLVANSNNKISLTLLDQAGFDEASSNPIGEDTIDAYPNWSVDIKDVISTIEISYDFDESTQNYLYKQTFFDANTEANFGKIKPLSIKLKGVRDLLSGNIIINALGQRLLSRFSSARPEIEISTQIDRSLLNVGDKVLLTSSQIPSGSGSLSFADSLEIVSRSINYLTGDVKFKLQFTSYAGVRGSYIAPCTSLLSVTSQSIVTFPAGRGDSYETGWKVRLFNKSTFSYEPDPINTIMNIDGDVITFANPWTTPVDSLIHAIRFADYNQVTDSQKKYSFVGKLSGANFDDDSGPYKIGI